MEQVINSPFRTTYLEPENMNFFINPNGVVCLDYKDIIYWKISARRALPQQELWNYIFLYNYNDREIGAIRCIDELDKDTRKVVKGLLGKRYMICEIESVESIIDKFNVLMFRGRDTGHRDFEFTVIQPKSHVNRARSGGFLIYDNNDNIYHIRDPRILSKDDLIKVERYC